MMENYEVHPEIAAELAEAAKRGRPIQQAQATPAPAPQPVQQQPVEQMEQEQVEEQTPEPIAEPTPQSEDSGYKVNMRIKALRLAKEKAEKERDDILRLAQMNQSFNKPREEEKQVTKPRTRLRSDELVEGTHVNELDDELQQLKQQLLRQQQQSYNENSKLRLKAKFNDFEQVVNQETIEMLQVLQPEIAQTLNSTQDIYAAGVTAYNIIKNLGLKPEANYESDIKRIQTNAAKPKPMVSINPQQGESALSQANAFANGLTPELKDQLYKEMQAARRNY
jgi:hypothetical protein